MCVVDWDINSVQLSILTISLSSTSTKKSLIGAAFLKTSGFQRSILISMLNLGIFCVWSWSCVNLTYDGILCH